MSYEGFTQAICVQGHRYDGPEIFSYNDTKCPVCGSEPAFVNSVDDTNCDSVGIVPDELWEQFLITAEVRKKCDLGHEHVTTPAIYRIPTEEELRPLRRMWDGDGEQKKLVPLDDGTDD